MSLNELIRFAKMHDIDFDKNIVCINMINDNLVLDNLGQIAMKEIDKKNTLVIIPSSLSYNADMNKEFELCDTVNSCKESLMEMIFITTSDIPKYRDSKFYDVYRCVHGGKWRKCLPWMLDDTNIIHSLDVQYGIKSR